MVGICRGLNFREEQICLPDATTDVMLDASASTPFDAADTSWDTEAARVGSGTRTGEIGERVIPKGIEAAAGITMEVT